MLLALLFTASWCQADFPIVLPPIPTPEVEIRGILYYETVGMDIGKQFVIKPRFADDISISDTTY